jgi:hypothetical protein
MTITQRWKKALTNAIVVTLFVLLVDRFLIDRYFESNPFNEAMGFYGMIGLGYLFGWFDGGGTEKQAEPTLEPTRPMPLPPPPAAGRPNRDGD